MTAASTPSDPDRTKGILLETARQLASSLEPAAIFDRLRRSVCGAMRCDGLIVSSFDRGANLIRCDYAWVGGNELDPATLPPLRFRADSGGMQTEVIRTGRPKLFSDVVQRVQDPKGRYYEVDPEGHVRDLRDAEPPKSQSAIMTPLLHEGVVVGVVQVMADAEGVYTAADLELLEGVSLLLAVALENARLFDAVRDADRRKEEFLATLSHELRNPLNPIRNAVDLLRRRADRDAETRWAEDVIQRQVVHLSRLIDDLLDVSRITQGKLDLRRDVVALDEVLAGAVESVRSLVDAAGQRLEVRRASARVMVHGDPVRLAQVFSNLIDNASKYTPRGGRIEVGVERRGDAALVTVCDEGRGIAADHLPHVFDLFYQGHRAPGRGDEGLGIGLTIVKRLVDLHGGTIEASSDGPDRGSRFVVRLPAVAAPEVAAVAAPATPAAIARTRRILVVDDNRDSAETMARLLQGDGHQTEIAYDGEAALRVAEGFRPDVMLLDIGMPGLSGYDVAQRLRSAPWGRELLLIAATGWGQQQDRQRSRDAGFDAHLVKPVDSDTVSRLIEQLGR